MFKKITKHGTFSCFSPPVMIATFVLEVGLAAYLVMRRQLTATTKVTVLLLLSLATFQLAEYGICENFGVEPNQWAHIGFIAITLLPPLGLHLVHLLAKKRSRVLVPLAYAAAAMWVGVFLFGGVLDGQACRGNYVIFYFSDPAEIMYYGYYDVLLLIAMVQAWRFSRQSRSKQRKTALLLLLGGYASFIVPAIIVQILYDFKEVSDSPLPSIMCGFAVFLAVILSFGVIPRSVKEKKK